MKAYRIHLIRHALTQDNIDGIYAGRTDSPLCRQGKEQLICAKEDYIYPHTDYVFTSPLKRCRETADILYPHIKPIVMEDLTECNLGEFEGRTPQELHEKEPAFDKWIRGDRDIKPPFGESNEDFAKRVCECFVKMVDGIIKAGAENTVIITHAGVISTILSNFGIPEADASQWLTPSCCGYTLLVSHYLWMSGRKVEVIKEIPESPEEEKQGNYYDGWDYYPNDDDFDISEYLD